MHQSLPKQLDGSGQLVAGLFTAQPPLGAGGDPHLALLLFASSILAQKGQALSAPITPTPAP